MPQNPLAVGAGGKQAVCKDLVIWPRAKMTCWNEQWQLVHVPLAIMEWKLWRSRPTRPREACAHDLTWLKTFTARHSTLGYCVTMSLGRRAVLLRCAVLHAGREVEQWNIEP